MSIYNEARGDGGMDTCPTSFLNIANNSSPQQRCDKRKRRHMWKVGGGLQVQKVGMARETTRSS